MAISDVISAIKYGINSTIGKSEFKPIDQMLTDLKTTIDNSITAQVNALTTKITAVETTANNANTSATNLNSNKMDKSNPTGTGTFSVSRTSNTTVGVRSFAFQGEASAGNAVALGYLSKAYGGSSAALSAAAVAYNNNCIAMGSSSIAGDGLKETAADTRSIAIGYGANAQGTYAIAIGSNANAGLNSISGNIAIGLNAGTAYSGPSIALGSGTHVYGANSVAVGISITMGVSNINNSPNSVAVGTNIVTKGTGCIAIGDSPLTGASSISPTYATAIGRNASATTNNSIAMGYGAFAGATDAVSSGFFSCIALGPNARATNNAYQIAVGPLARADSGAQAIAIGYDVNAIGERSIAISSNAVASAYRDIAIGSEASTQGTNVGNTSNIAIGANAKGYGGAAIALGTSTRTTAYNALSIGHNTTTEFTESYTIGSNLIAVSSNNCTLGSYNAVTSSGQLVVGNGISTARSNCFRVTGTAVYAKGNYNASGADYAEMFKWADDNPNNEDRAGLFVKLDGEEISTAENENDFILGIVSAAPSICGDTASEDWQGRFECDVFGRLILENIEISEKTEETTDPETGETRTEIVAPAHTRTWYKQNPNWNPDEKYIPREDRPEWDPVGLIGKLVMVDDGTAEVNGYVKPSKGGIATKADGPTRFRVMKRIDDTHIRILMLNYVPQV